MADFILRAGELKHKIQIQQYAYTVNADDIPVKDWVTVLDTRAKVVNLYANEYLQNRADGSDITKSFYIRCPRNLDITDELQIVHKGEIYNITYVNNVKDLGKYLEIRTHKKK